MSSIEMPVTQRTRLFRKLLGIVWVMSISSITLSISDLGSALMDVGFNPAQLGWKQLLFNAILLVGSSLLCWMSYRGNRRNLMPPTWGLVAMVTLVWTAILLNRLA
jgi:hypothetical protein